MRWLLWQRANRGPTVAILENRGDGPDPMLSELESKTKIGSPIKLKQEDDVLPLSVLARLYPIPGSEVA